MDFLAIIQARTGSSRLPNKVLLPLEDKTVLEHVYNRVGKSQHVSSVLVATTIDESDLAIVRLCAAKGMRVFCGAEDDVLDRYYQAARSLQPKNVVRITADCPMIDPSVIDLVISAYCEANVDYAANTLKETYPDGQDVEVFSFKVLHRVWQEASLASEREHVTPYIRNQPHKFRLTNVENTENHSDKRWTLDQREDYEFLKKIFHYLYKKKPFFEMADIIRCLKEHPELEKINNGIIRNEGYQISMQKDAQTKANER